MKLFYLIPEIKGFKSNYNEMWHNLSKSRFRSEMLFGFERGLKSKMAGVIVKFIVFGHEQLHFRCHLNPS